MIDIDANDLPPFVFVVCQIGSENFCKSEIGKHHPDFKFAFSRPGLLTFKAESNRDAKFVLKSAFARTYGFSYGTHQREMSDEFAAELYDLFIAGSFDVVHFWQRQANETAVASADTSDGASGGAKALLMNKFDRKVFNVAAEPDQKVLDVIEVDEGQFLIGFHRAVNVFQRWPGGKPDLKVPKDMISRAYLKTMEAVYWSRIPIRGGDVCVELGAAPGGSAQALLELGCQVIAVDPALLDDRLLNAKGLTYIRKRGRELRKAELAAARWLLADMNVAPKFTLDTVEDIVTHEKLSVKGLLLTVKIMDGKVCEQLDEYLARVKSWGFRYVTARQLFHNHKEFCLLALRNKGIRRN
jgi:23S rRNA (cytidine2498-2'-O)-methyltransferase